MNWDLEELARGALELADVPLPVDPDVLAFRLGLAVYDGGPGCDGLLIGRRIFVDETLRRQRRAFAIAHELGHHLLRQAGLETPGRNDERGADYMASAMLLPRDDFERDLRRVGWDLDRLAELHAWASYEALARRIVALREARAFVFDRPLPPRVEAPRWYSVPGGLRPTPEEREAAREAVASGRPVEVRAGVTGWAVVEADWIRAITLAPRESAHLIVDGGD